MASDFPVLVFGGIGTEVVVGVQHYEIVVLGANNLATWRTRCDTCRAPFFVQTRSGHLPVGSRCPTHVVSDEARSEPPPKRATGMISVRDFIPLPPDRGRVTVEHASRGNGVTYAGEEEVSENRPVQQLPRKPPSTEQAILPQLSRGVHEKMAEVPPAFQGGKEERQLSQLQSRSVAPREDQEDGVSELREFRQPDAPSGLRQSEVGGVVVSSLPYEAPFDREQLDGDPFSLSALTAELAGMAPDGADEEEIATPQPTSNDMWRRRVQVFAESRMWLPDWGPRPDQAGCRAPEEIMRMFSR